MGLREAIATAFGFKSSVVYASAPTAMPEYIDLSKIREMLGGVSAEHLYRTQPHLRTVISFRARNVAQLGLHTFVRESDTDRRRVRDGAVAATLAQPNPAMTGVELIYSLMSDRDLYDYALWHVVRSADSPSGWHIWPIPPSWVRATRGGTAWEPDEVVIQRPNSRPYPLKMRDLVVFHGWNPGNPAQGSSAIDAVKDVLAEQISAAAYRRDVWERGAQFPGYLTRPKDGPEWSDPARERFARSWKAKWIGSDGTDTGGTPLLEGGMEYKTVDFSARERDWIDGVKLSLSTVAQVYHVNPTMVGLLDEANYSNVKEFRKMLYGDSLGWDITAIESRINTFLVPMLEGATGTYVEFNIEEKLRGDLEELTKSISTATGRPWMTTDEGRALRNMRALGGNAAELATPLNLLIGGQTSPQDGQTEGRGGGSLPDDEPKALTGPTMSRKSSSEPLLIKAEARADDAAVIEGVLAKFYARQSAVVLSRLGSKDAEWWDEDRWNTELSDDLFALAVKVVAEIGDETMVALGWNEGDFTPAHTRAFLRAVADSRAGAINSTTRDQIEKALAGEVGEDAVTSTPAGVFENARTNRAKVGAITLATGLAAFAIREAGKQTRRPGVTKTWTVTSSNPRPAHARMNGETVGVEDLFSNGADGPGDPVLDADGVAGCMCTVTITIP